MEYNKIKYMRQRHLPTPRFLTVQLYLATVIIVTLLSRDVSGSTLGSKCQHDLDCTDFIKGSSCSTLGYCECAPYYVQYNTTTCLSSQLLGGDCALHEQCTMKVANSSCLDGACRCVEGFLQFRKHTCLAPAPPSSVCYSHAHCQMFNERTHCEFLIPNLFGRCQCTAPAKLNAGLCVDSTTEDVMPSTVVTTTSPTTIEAPTKKNEYLASDAPEQHIASTQSTFPTPYPLVEEHHKVILVEQNSSQKKPEENSNNSVEEETLEDDKDSAFTTSRTPFIGDPTQEIEQHQPHEASGSAVHTDMPNMAHDYPHNIKVEEDQTQSQNQGHTEDHTQNTATTEEEDHSDEYGHVVDNTMNFDYEAAQEEMEENSNQDRNELEVEEGEDLPEQEKQGNGAENNEDEPLEDPEASHIVNKEKQEHQQHFNNSEAEKEEPEIQNQDEVEAKPQKHIPQHIIEEYDAEQQQEHNLQNEEHIEENEMDEYHLQEHYPKPEEHTEQYDIEKYELEQQPEHELQPEDNLEDNEIEGHHQQEHDAKTEEHTEHYSIEEYEPEQQEDPELQPEEHIEDVEMDEHHHNSKLEEQTEQHDIEKYELGMQQEQESQPTEEHTEEHKMDNHNNMEHNSKAEENTDQHNIEKYELEQQELQELQPEEYTEEHEIDEHHQQENDLESQKNVEEDTTEQHNSSEYVSENDSRTEQYETLHHQQEELQLSIHGEEHKTEEHEKEIHQENESKLESHIEEKPQQENKHEENELQYQEHDSEPQKHIEEHEIENYNSQHESKLEEHEPQHESSQYEQYEAQNYEEHESIPADHLNNPESEHAQDLQEKYEVKDIDEKPENQGEKYKKEQTTTPKKGFEEQQNGEENEAEHYYINNNKNEPVQIHIPEEEYFENKDADYEQHTGQAHEEILISQKEQDALNDLQLDKVHDIEQEQEQESITNKPELEQFHAAEREKEYEETSDHTEKYNMEAEEDKENESETEQELYEHENYDMQTHEVENSQELKPDIYESEQEQLPEEEILNYNHDQQSIQEHEENGEHNKQNEQQFAEQQNVIMEHNKDHVVEDYVNAQDNNNQLDHIIPDNNQINKMPQNQHQPDNEQEKLSESIVNEIHHDLVDVVAAENESVQNENKATTQLPQVIMLTDDEVITTQSPVLENEYKNEAEIQDENNNNVSNNEVDVNNTLEQQQATDRTAVTESAITYEKIDIDDDEKYPSQEATEKMPDVGNHIDNEYQHFNQVVESLENEYGSTLSEVLTEIPIEADENQQNVNEFNWQNNSPDYEQKLIDPHEEKLEEEALTDGSVAELIELQTEQPFPEEEADGANNHTIDQEEVSLQPQILEESDENGLKHDSEDLRHSDSPLLSQPPYNDINAEYPIDLAEHEKDEEVQNIIDQGTYSGNQEILADNERQDNTIVNLANDISEINEVDNLIELTTISGQDEQPEVATTDSKDIVLNQNSIEREENSESVMSPEANQINYHRVEQVHTSITNEDNDKDHSVNIPDANEFNENAIITNEQPEEVTEAYETNYVPSNSNYNNEEEDEANDVNEIADIQPQEISNEVQPPQLQDNIEEIVSEKNGDHHQPKFPNFTQQHATELVGLENFEEFKESESISDILNNLMKDEVTLPTEYSEQGNFNNNLHSTSDSDEPDLLAEDSNISEETVMSQQLPTQDSTEPPIDPKDKLITFYPDMQEGELVQLPFTSQQQEQHESVEEASGDDETLHTVQKNEILKTEEHTTLSPLDLPFDTSIDYQPQQFESENLVLETTTNASQFLEDIESTTTAAGADESTTQTMLNLASRVTLMEPVAPISTTLNPLMQSNGVEVTSAVSINAPIVESILATKPTTEVRKRVELSLEAVSLGLSCHNDKQCQLADPHTVCNNNGVCDCASHAFSTHAQNKGQCSAEKTGCAPGTFQCRSSGVCISWFFVCDGRSDCTDASDEECTFNARLNQSCPSQAFQCGESGRCISRAGLCDGRKQCPHGEDELGCDASKSSESCPLHTFRCKSGECLPEYEYCNAIISCRDGSDEPPHLCGSRSIPNFFVRLLNAGGLMKNNGEIGGYCPHRCNNGRCRSTAIVCSGRDGCGDGTDEQTCLVCRCPAVKKDKSAINVSEFLARHRLMHLW